MIGGWSIDRESFALFVHAHRRLRRGLDMKDAARASNIPVAIFSRAENRIAVSAPNFLALCRFIGADPMLFLLDPATGRIVAPRETPGETPSGETRISPEAGARSVQTDCGGMEIPPQSGMSNAEGGSV